jgi:hypothetical protein
VREEADVKRVIVTFDLEVARAARRLEASSEARDDIRATRDLLAVAWQAINSTVQPGWDTLCATGQLELSVGIQHALLNAPTREVRESSAPMITIEIRG